MSQTDNFYLDFFAQGNQLYLRRIKNGIKVQEKIPIQPSLFFQQPNAQSDITNIHGDPVLEVSFRTISDAREYMRQKRFEELEHAVHGTNRFEYVAINELYPKEVQFDMDRISVVGIDIETEMEFGRIDLENTPEVVNLITVSHKGWYYTFGLGEFEPELLNSRYVHCHSEADLLEKFVLFWRRIDPDIVTGWNIDGFDIPYLIGRIGRICGVEMAKRLSPWGIVRLKEYEKFNKTQIKGEIAGISSLDYLELYKKFTHTMLESYRLDYVANHELGEGKIDYSEYQSMRDLYRNNWQKWTRYNIQDTAIIMRLEEKLKFINLACNIAYSAKVNYADVFMNTRIWDVLISNHLWNTRKMVVPTFGGGHADGQYDGAYVKDPVTGFHDWTVSFDLNSMYPSLMLQYNISPDTIVKDRSVPVLKPNDVLHNSEKFQKVKEVAQQHNLALACNGTMYRQDRVGFLPELIDIYFKRRKEAKKQKIEQEKILEEINQQLKEVA